MAERRDINIGRNNRGIFLHTAESDTPAGKRRVGFIEKRAPDGDSAAILTFLNAKLDPKRVAFAFPVLHAVHNAVEHHSILMSCMESIGHRERLFEAPPSEWQRAACCAGRAMADIASLPRLIPELTPEHPLLRRPKPVEALLREPLQRYLKAYSSVAMEESRKLLERLRKIERRLDLIEARIGNLPLLFSHNDLGPNNCGVRSGAADEPPVFEIIDWDLIGFSYAGAELVHFVHLDGGIRERNSLSHLITKHYHALLTERGLAPGLDFGTLVMVANAMGLGRALYLGVKFPKQREAKRLVKLVQCCLSP